MTAWRFLPEGTDQLGPAERVIWRGRPLVRGLARDLFHLRLWFGYFALLAFWDLASAFHDGLRAKDAVIGLAAPLAAALAVTALVYLGAWSIAVTTEYLLTDRRVVMRIGVAFPISLSVPLQTIGSAELRRRGGNTGDICLAFAGTDRLAYLLLWPHARPGQLRVAQPMLRNIPDAQTAAVLLADALLAAAPTGANSPLIIRQGATASSLDSSGSASDRLVNASSRRFQSSHA